MQSITITRKQAATVAKLVAKYPSWADLDIIQDAPKERAIEVRIAGHEYGVMHDGYAASLDGRGSVDNPMTGYKVIQARYPELVQLTKAELEEMAAQTRGSKDGKRAKEELERRKANRAAKREARKGVK